MSDLAKLQPLLRQAQAAIIELEVGSAAVNPRAIPAAVAKFIRELEAASSELQSEVVLLNALLREAEALMGRFDAVVHSLAGIGDE